MVLRPVVLQVYVANSTKFPKQEFVKRSLSILGQGLVLSDGDLWQRQRRLIHPSFSMREIKVCFHEATAPMVTSHLQPLLRLLSAVLAFLWPSHPLDP